MHHKHLKLIYVVYAMELAHRVWDVMEFLLERNMIIVEFVEELV